MTASLIMRRGPAGGLAWALALAAMLMLSGFLAGPAVAQQRAQVLATNESGFGRLVIAFNDRNDLPAFRVRADNGVLAIEFDEPFNVSLPDVAVLIPDYVSVARVDPDRRGIRLGLRTAIQVNRMEAGERLFIDLLPADWQGLPPALPPEVVAELAERAAAAEERARQARMAELARLLNPVATVRVGRNPTFVRVHFDWSADTAARFTLDEGRGLISFDWPVEIDLYPLVADLPAEITAVDNRTGADGSHVVLELAEGVAPRFYQSGPRNYILDIDIDPQAGIAAAITAQEARDRLQRERHSTPQLEHSTGISDAAAEESADAASPAGLIVPTVSMAGGTVRVSFPFEEDVGAAVFRRGDVVWMLFDTDRQIGMPATGSPLDTVVEGFEVIPAATARIVRMGLARERLATLSSEGRSWVLSLGDELLAAAEPMRPLRQRDEAGEMSMIVDVARPSRMHEFRDPVVGDVLKVVTVYPPARGLLRTLDYVDFDVLRSAHGLVIKPQNEALDIKIEAERAIVRAPRGLAVSTISAPRPLPTGAAPQYRSSYIDLAAARIDDPLQLARRSEELADNASRSEGAARDAARLELAQFYIANGLAFEAIGVLAILEGELETRDLRRKVQLARGIADTLAHRPAEAVAAFSAEIFADDVDVLLWRTIALAELHDFVRARADAVVAETVLPAYPEWLRARFLLAGARAAVETRDPTLARRYLGMIPSAHLEPEQVSLHQLLHGRIAEIDKRFDDAIDLFSQVIAAEHRPLRAEAVYRTLLVLDQTDRIDVEAATQALSAEVLMWRGGPLEADMQSLLAHLYFRSREYRLGFETARQTVAYYPESRVVNALQAEAQETFSALYLDGGADALEPVEALALYYDFRQLTPSGVRGDEMIRNLARRLVKVDLLAQAGDLLEYQMDNRLKGAAQAQIAADLAVIRIADRAPEAALRALNRTRLADLSPLLERQRRILEARGLIDAGRESVALDLLRHMEGRDADLLRIEANWRGKNYGAAAELIEVMYAPGVHHARLLAHERMDVIRAAVGFALARDALSLSRLRAKFGDLMASSPEWAMFDFVTRDLAPTSVEFRKVAREVAGMDSLDAFLEAYRSTYGAADRVMPERASLRRDA